MISTPVTDAWLAAEIAGERLDLAEVLGSLPAASWDARSLCEGWAVRDVATHITMPFRYSTARFAAELIRSGGRFGAMADRCARRDAAALTGPELAAVLRAAATHPWRPPGGGLAGALTHDVIHGLDIMVPLRIGRSVPAERLRIVLSGLTERKALGFFGAELDGVELHADDLDWSFGSGSLASGAAQDLALVLCGRRLPAGRLRGAAAARFTAC